MTWETVPLASVATVEMGQAPAGDSYNDLGEGVGLIAGPGDFKAGRLAVKKFTSRPTKLSQSGDLIVGIRASIGDVVVSDGTYCLGRGVAAIRPNPESIDADYLRHSLTWLKGELASRGRGATFLTVSRADIASLPIPLPPLAEQRRIAAILDEADALRVCQERATGLLVESRETVFAGRSSKIWQQVRLADVASLQGGLTLNARRKSLALEVPYLRVADVYRGAVRLSELKTMGVTQSELDRTSLVVDDVLVVEGHGNIDELGRAGRIVELPLMPLTHQNHLFRLRPLSGVITGQFLEASVNSAPAREHLRRVANTTSGLNTLNASSVRATPIALPSMAEQVSIGAELDEHDALVGVSRSRLSRLDALFASLQHRAFRGEL